MNKSSKITNEYEEETIFAIVDHCFKMYASDYRHEAIEETILYLNSLKQSERTE